MQQALCDLINERQPHPLPPCHETLNAVQYPGHWHKYLRQVTAQWGEWVTSVVSVAQGIALRKYQESSLMMKCTLRYMMHKVAYDELEAVVE